MAKSGLLNSSVGRKFAMALSAIFLMIFLLQHCFINFTSVCSPETFNELSHFMGYNPLIQYVMQPVLMFAVVFHFAMGFVLEFRNRKARVVSYAKNNGGANSTWVSRNMIYSGLTILAFLVLHFIDFWIPEMDYKYWGDVMPESPDRYYPELVEKFHSHVRVIAYVISFIFLALHLLHGFNSAFQSMGANNKYTKALKGFGKLFAIVIPLLFIYIALYHHFNAL